MKNWAKQIKNIKDKYKLLRGDAWENYRKVCQDESIELSKIINFEGKYLKILLDEDGNYPNSIDQLYIYVKSQTICGYLGSDEKLGIRLEGIGFIYQNYSDSIYFSMDSVTSHEFEISEIEKNLEIVTEITQEDFLELFSELQEKSSLRFINILKNK